MIVHSDVVTLFFWKVFFHEVGHTSIPIIKLCLKPSQRLSGGLKTMINYLFKHPGRKEFYDKNQSNYEVFLPATYRNIFDRSTLCQIESVLNGETTSPFQIPRARENTSDFARLASAITPDLPSPLAGNPFSSSVPNSSTSRESIPRPRFPTTQSCSSVSSSGSMGIADEHSFKRRRLYSTKRRFDDNEVTSSPCSNLTASPAAPHSTQSSRNIAVRITTGLVETGVSFLTFFLF
jgi:hypothetical protein